MIVMDNNTLADSVTGLELDIEEQQNERREQDNFLLLLLLQTTLLTRLCFLSHSFVLPSSSSSYPLTDQSTNSCIYGIQLSEGKWITTTTTRATTISFLCIPKQEIAIRHGSFMIVIISFYSWKLLNKYTFPPFFFWSLFLILALSHCSTYHTRPF